jgi:hypothetical protein
MTYTFQSKRLPAPSGVADLDEGLRQAVHFTLPTNQLKAILATIEAWFADRDDVILIDHGTTCKQELGFITLEWDEHEIDPIFIAILADADFIDDFTIYTHDIEE